jgi:uncharacterized protein (DUF1800 family)
MESRFSRPLLRPIALLALVSSMVFAASAQEDPDPNSPTPILLSEMTSTRALAHTPKRSGRTDLSSVTAQAFDRGSKVNIYVTNLVLMEGEGANAFRVYAEDKDGHTYMFPVLGFERHPLAKDIYTVTILLKDAIGYWEPPAVDGDIYIYLTWRGLASNTVKLGYGEMGGSLREISGAKPTPFGTAKSRAAMRAEATQSPEYVGYRWSGDRHRFQQQAAFGPTAILDNRIRRIGLKSWLAEQFEAPYPSLSNPYPNQPLKPTNAPADCDGDQTTVPDVPPTCNRDTYGMYPLQAWNTKEMFYGDAQLRHRVSWALSQIWVTSGNDIQQSRHMVEYHKVLSDGAFGNYRTLMKRMTLHPTMGQYLDMALSTKTNPNENYPREVMQLFSIGLFMLNQDGTLQLDGSNEPIPTYDQNGVNNLTKVMTGWSLCSVAASCPNLVSGAPNYIDPMLLNAGVTTLGNNRHDLTAKTLLTYPGSGATMNVIACTGTCDDNLPNIATYANASLDQAIDNLFLHPNVAPFVSKIMIQHMVTSSPTPAYVGRVAAVFNNNGFGTRGDMKAVVKAILLDPEARGDLKTDPNFGKMLEPMQFATNYLRLFGVRGDPAFGSPQSDGVIFERGEFQAMAQIPFRSPTVFNYYPPDFVIPGTALLGPEFALMTTGTAIGRANFMNRFAFNVVTPTGGIPAVVPVVGGTTNTPLGTSLDLSDLQALAAADPSGNLLVDELNRRMLYGTMPASMKASILTSVTAVTMSPTPTNTQTLARVGAAIYLIGTSSRFQVQR